MAFTLSASILSADFSNLKKEISECENAGSDWIHIDVMDGHFVPNLTMGPFIVATCRRITQLPLDCHLMVEKPERLIEAFVSSGASSITIHPERNPQVVESLKNIKASGCLAGLALNPETPVSSVKSLLPYTDLLLIMTVNPGYSGQSFIPNTLQKIIQAKYLVDQYSNIQYLQVDGGINQATIKSVLDAGANNVVAASAIFTSPIGIAKSIQALRTAGN